MLVVRLTVIYVPRVHGLPAVLLTLAQQSIATLERWLTSMVRGLRLIVVSVRLRLSHLEVRRPLVRRWTVCLGSMRLRLPEVQPRLVMDVSYVQLVSSQ